MANVNRERQKMLQQKERLALDTKELITSAEEMLHATASYTGAEIDLARSRLRQQLASAQEKAEAWKLGVRQKYQSTTATADECVHQRPWTSVGVMFVLGLGLAYCLRGK